jgi:hypothetical protein
MNLICGQKTSKGELGKILARLLMATFAAKGIIPLPASFAYENKSRPLSRLTLSFFLGEFQSRQHPQIV